MCSSPAPAPVASKADSERVYLEILRLERERAEFKRRLAAAAATQKAHIENAVGRTFFNKVMAKRKARLAAAGGPEGDTSSGADEDSGGCGNERPLLPQNSVPSKSDRRQNLEISLEIQPDRLLSTPIPRITDRMQAIPPEPVATPTIVCPSGFKNMKFVDSFTLKFTPPECCGGPRNVEVHAKDEDKCLCFGRIESESEVFLQKQNDAKEMEELCAFKLDTTTAEWTISFPELESVAYMIKPKPGSRVSASQIYEIFSADGCSNYFNLGVELEKSGSSRSPDYIFRFLNSNLATVGTVILLSNYRVASVTIDGSLWPSQKAVILGTAMYLSWDMVQELRRKAAWIRVLIASGILLTILMGILLVNIYLIRRED